ncbi:hypothetical protein EMCRGX_G028568 [Ephydatia muelleri]|eukprot:Em0020g83a
MACAGSNYTPGALVEAFHRIPHVDINLNTSTDAFSVSLNYFQAVIIWACIPILVCVCLFILMSVYFILICCCCCCGVERGKSNTSRWACAVLQAIFMLFCLALAGASFWAEVALHTDITSVISSTNSISNVVSSASLEAVKFNQSTNTMALTRIQTAAYGNSNATSASINLISYGNQLNTEFESISGTLGSLWDAGFSSSLDVLETARHWAVIGYFILVSIVLVIILIASLVRKVPFVVVMLVILFFTTLLTWIAVGGSLATLMVTSDICHNPNTVVLEISSSPQTEYYLNCNSTCPAQTNPFSNQIGSINTANINIRTQLGYILSNQTLVNLVAVDLSTTQAQFTIAQNASQNLIALTGCTPINKDYTEARQSLCNDAILHAVVQFGLVATLAVCLIVQLFCGGFHAGLISGPSDDEEIILDPFGDLAAGGVSSTNAWNYRSNTARSNPESIPLNDQPPKYSDLTGGNGNHRTSGGYDHFNA